MTGSPGWNGDGRRAVSEATVSGFRYDPDLLSERAVEKIIDRALLMMVIQLTPGYLSRGGVPKVKTRKEREIEHAELQAVLRLMVNDFGITTEDGYTETAMWAGLGRLGEQRGVLAGPVPWKTTRDHGPWSLWDVMSDERKDRDYPGRRASARGRAPRY